MGGGVSKKKYAQLEFQNTQLNGKINNLTDASKQKEKENEEKLVKERDESAKLKAKLVAEHKEKVSLEKELVEQKAAHAKVLESRIGMEREKQKKELDKLAAKFAQEKKEIEDREKEENDNFIDRMQKLKAETVFKLGEANTKTKEAYAQLEAEKAALETMKYELEQERLSKLKLEHEVEFTERERANMKAELIDIHHNGGYSTGYDGYGQPGYHQSYHYDYNQSQPLQLSNHAYNEETNQYDQNYEYTAEEPVGQEYNYDNQNEEVDPNSTDQPAGVSHEHLQKMAEKDAQLFALQNEKHRIESESRKTIEHIESQAYEAARLLQEERNEKLEMQRQVKQQHSKQIADLIATHANTLEQLKFEKDEEINKLKDDLESQALVLVQNGRNQSGESGYVDEEHARASADGARYLGGSMITASELISKHEAQMIALQDQHAQTLKRLQEEANAETRQLRALVNQRESDIVDAVKREYEGELHSLARKHQEEVESIKAEYESTMKAQQQRQEEELEKERNIRNNRLLLDSNDLKDEIEMNIIEEELTRVREEKEKEFKEKQTEITKRFESSQREMVTRHKVQLLNAKKDNEQALRDLRNQSEQEKLSALSDMELRIEKKMTEQMKEYEENMREAMEKYKNIQSRLREIEEEDEEERKGKVLLLENGPSTLSINEEEIALRYISKLKVDSPPRALVEAPIPCLSFVINAHQPFTERPSQQPRNEFKESDDSSRKSSESKDVELKTKVLNDDEEEALPDVAFAKTMSKYPSSPGSSALHTSSTDAKEGRRNFEGDENLIMKTSEALPSSRGQSTSASTGQKNASSIQSNGFVDHPATMLDSMASSSSPYAAAVKAQLEANQKQSESFKYSPYVPPKNMLESVASSSSLYAQPLNKALRDSHFVDENQRSNMLETFAASSSPYALAIKTELSSKGEQENMIVEDNTTEDAFDKKLVEVENDYYSKARYNTRRRSHSSRRRCSQTPNTPNQHPSLTPTQTRLTPSTPSSSTMTHRDREHENEDQVERVLFGRKTRGRSTSRPNSAPASKVKSFKPSSRRPSLENGSWQGGTSSSPITDVIPYDVQFDRSGEMEHGLHMRGSRRTSKVKSGSSISNRKNQATSQFPSIHTDTRTEGSTLNFSKTIQLSTKASPSSVLSTFTSSTTPSHMDNIPFADEASHYYSSPKSLQAKPFHDSKQWPLRSGIAKLHPQGSSRRRQHRVLIDASSSMRIKDNQSVHDRESRYHMCQKACERLIPELSKNENDLGIYLYFFNNEFKKFENIRTVQEVKYCFGSVHPKGGTNLTNVLTHVLQTPHSSPSSTHDTLDKPKLPLSVYILTDGAPENRNTVEEVIRSASDSLDYDDDLCILIIQIGYDIPASKWLSSLTDRLQCKEGVVKTTSLEHFRQSNISFDEFVMDVVKMSRVKKKWKSFMKRLEK